MCMLLLVLLTYQYGIPGFGPKEIAQGQHDGYIKKFAQGAAEFGKEYGGFFFTTMEEMNGNWFSWGKNSNFIPAWRHIWQIFEDQGANQYATWVWALYCTEGVPHFLRMILNYIILGISTLIG